jgi:hypothetical protein
MAWKIFNFPLALFRRIPFAPVVFDIAAYPVTISLFGTQRVMMISQNLAHLIHKLEFILDFHNNSKYHQYMEFSTRLFPYFNVNITIDRKYFHDIWSKHGIFSRY